MFISRKDASFFRKERIFPSEDQIHFPPRICLFCSQKNVQIYFSMSPYSKLKSKQRHFEGRASACFLYDNTI